ARGLTPLPRQLPSHPGLVVLGGQADRPDRAALRRRRLGRHAARGERAQGRRVREHDRRRRDRHAHPRRRLHPRPAHDGVRDPEAVLIRSGISRTGLEASTYCSLEYRDRSKLPVDPACQRRSTRRKAPFRLPAGVGRFLETVMDMWPRARLWLGKALILFGVPGILVDQTYEAAITQAKVRVHLGPLFSVVSVNGLDIYFHRLTGKIDGVGFSPVLDDTSDDTS